jgi:small conductance mechanosensitive channel
LQRLVVIVEERLASGTGDLAATASLMSEFGLETAEYQQLVVESTGEITADLLDAEVVSGLFQNWREQFFEGVREKGSSWFVKTLVFVLIIGAFRILAGITRRLVSRSVESARVNISQLLQHTAISWSSKIVTVIGVLVALSQLGIQIGPLLAGLGIAGFVLGFALQDSLSNFAAGGMILMYRPFDVGDVIEAAGVSGQVRKMSLVSTTILTFDNQTLIVPNTKIWGDVIRNVTAQTTRRVDLVFGIGYGDDIEHAETVLRDILAKHEKVLEDPAPNVQVHNLGESSVDILVRPWVRTEDYWPVFWDITREVKMRFDREGISIPFPQRDVHHYFVKPPEEAGS